MTGKKIQINPENHDFITFTEHLTDGWLSTFIKRDSETVKMIDFNVTQKCAANIFEQNDFESKLKKCIDFYFQNEKIILNMAVRFLKQLLLINKDYKGEDIFEELIEDDLQQVTVKIINLYEYKFALNFSLFNGYIECDVMLNHLVENRFLITGHEYNWAYRRF